MKQVSSLVSCYLSRIFMVLVVVEFSPDFFRQVFSLVSCHLSRLSWFWVFLLFWSRFLPYQQAFLLGFMVFLSIRSVCLVEVFGKLLVVPLVLVLDLIFAFPHLTFLCIPLSLSVLSQSVNLGPCLLVFYLDFFWF